MEPAVGASPVLLVDDDPRFLLSSGVTLRTSGISPVVTIEDSRQVIPFLQDGEAAAVVIDLAMPHLSGRELLQKLKELYPELPVVVMTGPNEVEIAVECMRAGAFDYLVKPVERQALLDRLGRYTFTTKVRSSHICVLSIDDDPRARRLVRDILAPEGFEVVEAGSGAEGLDLVDRVQPHLILLDLVMPGMSGFEVVARLQANPATAGIPVLVLTARDLTAADKQALNGHVLSVLHKDGEGRVDLLSWLDRMSERLEPAGDDTPHG